jgi:hypothetical protein
MNFQQLASAQGAAFDAMCRAILADFNPSGPFADGLAGGVGIEIDAAVGDTWIEFKGSARGDQPGLRRTDTVKKAIANAALASTVHDGAFVVMTSHLPAAGSRGERMLETAFAAGWLSDVVDISDRAAIKRLLTYLETTR